MKSMEIAATLEILKTFVVHILHCTFGMKKREMPLRQRTVLQIKETDKNCTNWVSNSFHIHHIQRNWFQ